MSTPRTLTHDDLCAVLDEWHDELIELRRLAGEALHELHSGNHTMAGAKLHIIEARLAALA